MSRPVISYDDITLPYDAPTKPSPRKKRKRNNNNHKKSTATAASSKTTSQTQHQHHWDDPTASLDDDGEEESRELTHDEIWDDSALIDAWNAAMEEYEAYHGPDKDAWKKPPVHKSPLWYNIPPKNPPPKTKSTSTVVDVENDSTPIDFDTFVPTHDPSLSIPIVEEEENPEVYTIPLTHHPVVSQDEAFERAIQASYWSGYWTGVYHHHSQSRQTQPGIPERAEAGQDIDNSSGSSSSEGGEEEFVSTQR